MEFPKGTDQEKVTRQMLADLSESRPFDMNTTDRKRGALIGLAVGDALGAAVEFRQPGTFSPVTCYRSGGPHDLEAGEWTDDTSLALALADSIGRGWDINNQIQEYIKWWEDGKYSVTGVCFDIGRTTQSALERYTGADGLEKDGVRFCADSVPESSGNGSIMRLAPVPIKYSYLYPDRIQDLGDFGEESSIPTHASPQCVAACRYMTVVLAALIQGEKREVVLDPEWAGLKAIEADLDPLILRVAKGSFRNGKVKGSGWVVASLEAALWAFYDAQNFEEAVLKAVNLGDDADTTGAVCGQFAGAYWGESGIPESLRKGLARQDMLEAAFKSLAVES